MVYIRSAGVPEDLDRIRELGAHWDSMGVYIPMFEVSAEGHDEQIKWWEPGQKVNLLAEPYRLQRVW